jgi:hypothetical protein
MSILDIASASRTVGNGPITFTPIEGCGEYVDSDNYTRALVTRDSDGAAHVIYARGAHADIVDAANESARLKFERAAALAELDKLPSIDDGDDDPDADDRATFAEIVADADRDMAALVKTRAVPTLHVARALAHYGAE